eukprot:s5972_g4.t1
MVSYISFLRVVRPVCGMPFEHLQFESSNATVTTGTSYQTDRPYFWIGQSGAFGEKRSAASLSQFHRSHRSERRQKRKTLGMAEMFIKDNERQRI